jgi:hypothetical protein
VKAFLIDKALEGVVEMPGDGGVERHEGFWGIARVCYPQLDCADFFGLAVLGFV